jgi:uncharacterized protein
MTVLETDQDSLSNAISGLGINGRDRRLQTEVYADNIMPLEARILWEGSRTAGVIVDRVSEDMVRQWVTYKLEDPKLDLALQDRVKHLNAKSKFLEATRACRMMGGACLVAVTQDAIDNTEALATPLAKNPVLHCLTKFDRSEISSWQLELNPTSENYGEPVTFMFSPATGAPTFRVHYSRALIFSQPVSGVSQKVRNSCFGPSCFEGLKQSILNFDTAHNHIHSICEKFGIRVISVAGLMQKSAQDGGSVINKRLAQMEMSASALRAYLLDKDNEEISSTTANVSGLSELIADVGSILSTQSRIPQSILFGNSPGGLNSTGTVEMESYHAFIQTQQEQVIRPALTKFLKMLAIELGAEEPHFAFAPLWSPSAQEIATAEKTEQDKFKVLVDQMAILIENGAMSGDEAREAAKANPLLAKFLDAKMMSKDE